jgi:hypothetical protein
MEKKGEIFNQLALISDLLEKINLNSTDKTIIIDLNKVEFDNFYKMVTSKINIVKADVDSKFSLKIGDINFVFNKNNV